MKKILFSCFVLLIFLCAKCEEDTPKNPIDLLPPATQTGANTFGCLVDGEAFTPDGRPSSLEMQYTFLNGGYYLSIGANRTFSDGIISIGCATNQLIIEEDMIYKLSYFSDSVSSSFGSYFSHFAYPIRGYTSQEYTGEMKITRFNDNVISGTFWFDVMDTEGVVHKIREGRFDVKN